MLLGLHAHKYSYMQLIITMSHGGAGAIKATFSVTGQWEFPDYLTWRLSCKFVARPESDFRHCPYTARKELCLLLIHTVRSNGRWQERGNLKSLVNIHGHPNAGSCLSQTQAHRAACRADSFNNHAII